MSRFAEDHEFDAIGKADWSPESVNAFLLEHPDWAPILDKRGEIRGLSCPALTLIEADNQ